MLAPDPLQIILPYNYVQFCENTLSYLSRKKLVMAAYLSQSKTKWHLISKENRRNKFGFGSSHFTVWPHFANGNCGVHRVNCIPYCHAHSFTPTSTSPPSDTISWRTRKREAGGISLPMLTSLVRWYIYYVSQRQTEQLVVLVYSPPHCLQLSYIKESFQGH